MTVGATGRGQTSGLSPHDVVAAVVALAPKIRAAGNRIESERRLPDDVVADLHAAGVFHMATPEAYGGPELDPMTQARVMEELSAADASVGWCAMIGVTAGYMAARVTPAAAERLFGGANALLAGQVAPLGRAEVVDGGYRVSGRWRFGSASQHATAFMGGCLVTENEQPRRTAAGDPELRVMLFPARTVRVLDTWDTIGLRGSGSHDYAVEDAFVPADESFGLFAAPLLQRPLYNYPLMFTANHVGMPLGIARTAIAEVVDLAKRKVMPTRKLLREEGQVQEAVARAEGKLGAARAYAYATIEEMWRTLSRGELLSERERAEYRIMLIHVHHAAKDILVSMFDTAGTSAIFRDHPLDRLMRDILVVCQHAVVQEKGYRSAGRMLLDLPAGDPFF